MKRIGALSEMRWPMRSHVFQAGYIAAVVALCSLLVQPAQAEPVDSLAVETESMDSLTVKKQGFSAPLRVGKKVASGGMMGAVLAYTLSGGGSGEGDGIGESAFWYVGFFVGYPLGVYLADWRESSFWLTCIGHGLGIWGAFNLLDLDSPNPSERAERAAWVTLLGAPILASELSRMVAAKRPKQSQDLRFSFGLVPDLKRGVSAIATLRF